jgi:hypothetical protein
MTIHPGDATKTRADARGRGLLHPLEHADILESVIGIKDGDHVCVLYDYSPIEQMPAVVAFLREGLQAGEQCIYVADETPASHVLTWLKAEKIEVDADQARGALQVWSRSQWRQPGLLDSIRKAAQVREVVESATAAGFDGVRFAVEMTWTLDPDLSAESIEDWEATSNDLMHGSRIKAMCLYGRKRLPSAVVAAGLRTHPTLLDAHGLRANHQFK